MVGFWSKYVRRELLGIILYPLFLYVTALIFIFLGWVGPEGEIVLNMVVVMSTVAAVFSFLITYWVVHHFLK